MIKHITPDQKLYPIRLLKMVSIPSNLYTIGKLPAENIKNVAIIGARFASDYGRHIAKVFGAAAADAGLQVITDMSLGIGGIAADEAQNAGGDVFAVLPSLDISLSPCYPPKSDNIIYTDLYERIKKTGGIISEYERANITADMSKARQRIVAALADAIIVIEARKSAGTLLTVDFALSNNECCERKTKIYAVPGRITDRLSDGCNRLIVDGVARPALDADQVMQEILES